MSKCHHILYVYR